MARHDAAADIVCTDEQISFTVAGYVVEYPVGHAALVGLALIVSAELVQYTCDAPYIKPRPISCAAIKETGPPFDALTVGHTTLGATFKVTPVHVAPDSVPEEQEYTGVVVAAPVPGAVTGAGVTVTVTVRLDDVPPSPMQAPVYESPVVRGPVETVSEALP